jgi:hypothetical protein
MLKVTATGTYPDGTTLPGQMFTALDAYSSPEPNGGYNDLLWRIFGELTRIDPTGISSGTYSLLAHSPSTTTTNADATSAWGIFQAGTFDQIDSKGLWLSFQLAVNTNKPGKYSVHLTYHVEYMRQNCPSCFQSWYRADLFDDLDYCYLRCNPGQTNNAQFISHNMPGSVYPGQTIPVTITIQNTGQTTWWPYDRGSYLPRFCSDCLSLYRLGSQNPAENTLWGLKRVDLSAPVLPGQTVTFSFTVTAPTTPGTYNWQWQMVQDVNPGTSVVEWFGASTPNVQVTVRPPDFTISSDCGSIYLYTGGYQGTCTIRLTSQGFAGTVTLSVSVSPAVSGGPMASVNPASLSLSFNGQGSAILKVTSGSATGQFTITVTGISGWLSHSVTIPLTIENPPPPDPPPCRQVPGCI